MSELEQRTMAKVTKRLVPFLILCYFVAYLDRVNVGFAGLTMRDDLHLSASAFGLGSGIFFIAYFFFEVPSNLLLHRFGASKWIARIMLTWGLISGATAFIGGETGFYVLRVMLGIAEAGFFPGIIFFLTLWFPSVYRGRIVGWFMAAIPASSVIGAPVSSLLLYLDGVAGLQGWKWMFIVEAVPALILSVVVFFYLTDRPAAARWLADDERDWLTKRLAAEEKQRTQATSGAHGLGSTLVEQPGTALAVVAVGAGLSAYASLLFGPWALLPYGLAAAALVLFGRPADRAAEGVALTVVRLVVLGVAVVIAGMVQTNVLQGVILQGVVMVVAGFISILSWRILALSLIYFGAVATNYGVGFWLPQIVKGFGDLTKLQIGLITAIPYVIGAVGMVWWGRRSDRKGERKLHTAIPLAIAGVLIGTASFVDDPVLKMTALSIAGFGVFASLPVFWTLPAAFLSGPAAAAGIAMINSLGNLSGFVGPSAMGWIKDLTGSFNGGLLLIGGLSLLAMLTVLVLPHDHRLEQTPHHH